MKILIVLFLAVIVFGVGGYFTYKLYLEPQEQLQMEKAQGPPPPLPDPTIPDFQHCVELQDQGQILEARTALADFVERSPQSSVIEEAKARLGKINTDIFLTTFASPEKQTYVVQKGDVITRVAAKLRTTPELIMKANALHGVMLRIGEHLSVAPANFSLIIHRETGKVTVLDNGKFFKEYSILGAPPPRAAARPATPSGKKPPATPRPPKILGKVTDRIAWKGGQRVTPFDKDKGAAYEEADHWILISPGGHNLYSQPASGALPPSGKPPGGGYALDPLDMRELAVILNKNTPVTIE